MRKFFFSERVIDEWNNLPRKAYDATTVNSFKNCIDPIFRKRRGLTISQRRLTAPVMKATNDVYIYAV